MADVPKYALFFWRLALVKSVWLKQSIFSIYFLYLILQNQNISCLFQWYDVITLISAVKALWGLWIYWLETSLFPNKTIETGFTMHHNLTVSFYKIPLYAYDGKTLHNRLLLLGIKLYQTGYVWKCLNTTIVLHKVVKLKGILFGLVIF